MHLDSRIKALAATASVAGLLVAMTAGGSASAAPQAHASACKVSNNVEAILDDSGSMNGTDPSHFRTKLMEAYIGLGSNQGKTLGAVKFSSDASVLFNPLVIGPNTKATMLAGFNNLVDSGGTDYDAGFSLANSSNPGATSRIFLSDGAPGTDSDLHRSPNITTYVVGLGVGNDANAVTELTQIANETGGPPPIFIEDAGQLQTAAAAISAGQSCKRLLSFTDVFNRVGQSAGHNAKAKGKVMDILTSWPNIGSVLNLGVGLPKAKSSVASAAKVQIKRSKGSNFASIRIKGLKKGQKVKIKIKAKALNGPTTATTQVIR
ncbi:MAG TPA: vWA domain-containing protein [Solirubrobacterales bacterium]